MSRKIARVNDGLELAFSAFEAAVRRRAALSDAFKMHWIHLPRLVYAAGCSRLRTSLRDSPSYQS